MVDEEEQKLKIFNTVHMNHSNDTPKKKYFRIEKNKPYSSKESHAKAIFRTKKDYNFLRRKTLREIETQKLVPRLRAHGPQKPGQPVPPRLLCLPYARHVHAA